MTTTPTKFEQPATEEEKKALARRIRCRLYLLRGLRAGLVFVLSVLSLTQLLGMFAGSYWNPRLPFLYDWLPLYPARALCLWIHPEMVIDGETAYDVRFFDMLLFYGVLLIVPWFLLCRRFLWIPCVLLSVALALACI